MITVETTAGRQTRMLQAGSGFLSQHSKEVFFGLGDAKGTVRASIRWPSGLVQELRDLPLNHRVWVQEGSEPSRIEAFRPRTLSAQKLDSHTPESRGELPDDVETWLLTPVAAPDFSLPDMNGQTQTLSSFRGKSVLLNFWVEGSASCREDLKLFNRLHKRWADQGLQLLTVNVDDLAKKLTQPGRSFATVISLSRCCVDPITSPEFTTFSIAICMTGTVT